MRSTKQDINGVLLLDKPLGISSNAALQQVKLLYNAKKAGHTGTLDPLATGLLPICLGEATKFSSFLLDSNKEYIATIKLGSTTTTYDAEGEVTYSSDVNSTYSEITAVVNGFLGLITQTPPIYSALKVNGKPLYKYARDGIDIEISSREITILELEILEFLEDNQFKLRVLCSKGTYIRSLAHDIGQHLGCGAHLKGLVRTKTNSFCLNKQINIDCLNNLSAKDRLDLLLPIDILIEHMPIFEITEFQYTKIEFGNPFFLENTTYQIDNNKPVRLYYNKKFLGTASITNDKVQPTRLLQL